MPDDLVLMIDVSCNEEVFLALKEKHGSTPVYFFCLGLYKLVKLYMAAAALRHGL